ncbi:MAG: nitrite/sulfite reductase [Myxococcota bacterium]
MSWIDAFETNIALKRAGRIDDRLFAETRLRHGVYGQRYDNGQRHDGMQTRKIPYPERELTKGPGTLWDAPGMVRIKVPMGRLSADQLEALAHVADRYSTGILHVTTRQDIQMHFVHLEDTPDLMRRLDEAGITTQEACGNAVRNVTACATAGVCKTESFDVTPYAGALADFLLLHDDTQDFGRKFKIAFSGCAGQACGLVRFHDLGCLAAIRDGQRGFEVYVGGGLGAVPRQADLYTDFVPADELLPLAQAICRVFARLGEKKVRTRARLKFLVEKLGIEEFRRLVEEERAILPSDERWSLGTRDLTANEEQPAFPAARADAPLTGAVKRWARHNVRPQRQEGYVTATLRLPLGDFTSGQARGLAAVMRRFTGDTLRATVEQNLLLRWVPEASLPELYDALRTLKLHAYAAGTLADITACPGTDTCKLGISASRGLAGELESRLLARLDTLHPEARDLRIKVSGCFNSCGQHHVADIGFLGVNRSAGQRRVPHFQLVVGGRWRDNGGAFGMRIAAYPAKRIPEVVDKLIEVWLGERDDAEPFAAYIARVGRARLKTVLDPLTQIPAYEDDPSFYTDWGDAREFTIGDKGIGECAGELVSATSFGLQHAERRIFEGQLAVEKAEGLPAATAAYEAMVSAARTLVRIKEPDVGTDPAIIVDRFRALYHDTKVFWDPYAKGKFARYLLATHADPPEGEIRASVARRHLDEATLFVEAAHACFIRLQDTPVVQEAS